MKIAIISIYPERDGKHTDFGGVAGYTHNFAEYLAPLKPKSQIYILANKVNHKKDTWRDNNLTVIKCFDRDIRFLWQLLHEVGRIKPDVVHIQQEQGMFGGVLTAYLLQFLILFLPRKTEKVITLHGVVARNAITTDFVNSNNSRLPAALVRFAFLVIFKPLCLWSDRIIVHEEVFRDIAIRDYGAAPEKIHVIPHGIELRTRMDKNEARQQLGIDAKRHVILFVGYLTGYKGIDLLIEGFSRYQYKDRSALLIIGAGHHPKLKNDKTYLEYSYNRLRDKAAEQINSSQYIWAGFIPDNQLQAYYSAADISVYPYTVAMSSSGPMALSIAYGQPFICSDVFSNFIKDPRQIFRKDANDLERCLADFFNYPIGQNESKRLRDERLWPVVAEKTYNLYRKTVQ